MAPHSSTLAWKIPQMEEPGRLQSMGSLRVGHDWVTSLSLFTFMHWRRKWQPTPVFLPGESQGREAWWLPSMGSHRVRHDWSDLAAAAALLTSKQSFSSSQLSLLQTRGLTTYLFFVISFQSLVLCFILLISSPLLRLFSRFFSKLLTLVYSLLISLTRGHHGLPTCTWLIQD